MKKLSIQQYSAVGMLLFGCVLTACGFFTEPVGQVHNSVLYILGQALVYAGSVFGLKNYVDIKLHDNK